MPIPKSQQTSSVAKLKTVKRKDGIWIVGPTPDGWHEAGPYRDKSPTDKQELADDLKGLIQFWGRRDEPGFITSEGKSRPKPKHVEPEPQPVAKNLLGRGRPLL